MTTLTHTEPALEDAFPDFIDGKRALALSLAGQILASAKAQNVQLSQIRELADELTATPEESDLSHIRSHSVEVTFERIDPEALALVTGAQPEPALYDPKEGDLVIVPKGATTVSGGTVYFGRRTLARVILGENRGNVRVQRLDEGKEFPVEGSWAGYSARQQWVDPAHLIPFLEDGDHITVDTMEALEALPVGTELALAWEVADDRIGDTIVITDSGKEYRWGNWGARTFPLYYQEDAFGDGDLPETWVITNPEVLGEDA